MQSNTPLASTPLTPLVRYQQAIATYRIQPHEAQYQAVVKLEKIYQNLLCRAGKPPENKLIKALGTCQYISSLFHKIYNQPPVQGLYMWGGAGQGKTWMMDLFFDSLPGTRKCRLHFHHFMLHIHQELSNFQGHANPLACVADNFKKYTDVICLDEFFVADITDAMILATLLQALFAHGITILLTSNIAPEQLYHQGLQRARFLPAITLIKKYCAVINIDTGIDYRLHTLPQAGFYLTPINAQTEKNLAALFVKLAGTQGEQGEVLTINHRPLTTLRSTNGVLAVDFSVLCQEPRSQLDYITLATLYHTVIIHKVRPMSMNDESIAKRFLLLIDELYERKVKLAIGAEVPLNELYQGAKLNFEYQRCLSRLHEMQSTQYINQTNMIQKNN